VFEECLNKKKVVEWRVWLLWRLWKWYCG